MTTAEPSGTFARRVEEASLNAWPALQQVVYDGWLLRLAGGFTKRANSVVPLYAGSMPIGHKLAFCTALYRRAGLEAIVRLATVHPLGELDATLAASGYRRIDPTLVLTRDLSGTPAGVASGFKEAAVDDWLDIYCRLSDMPPSAHALHRALLRGIAGVCVFGVIEHGAQPVACGLGVVEDDLVGLFDVVTLSAARRLGYGRTLLAGLFARGVSLGAKFAYLQVMEDNAAAIRLYRALEFAELYRYWYRVPPDYGSKQLRHPSA